MSPFKWRKLKSVSVALNIDSFVTQGVRLLEDKEAANGIPEGLFGTEIHVEEFDTSKAEFFNYFTQRKLKNIREEEMNSPMTSEESLILLDIIVSNARSIITDDVNICGIIAIGQYLRQRGDRIDYEKLETWLLRLGLIPMSDLFSSMLIDCLHFSQDELPFMRRYRKNARQAFLSPISKALEKHHASNSLRMQVSMLENITCRCANAISMVTDVEE